MNLFARRLLTICVALLLLGAYSERAFARFAACECSVCPEEIAASAEGIGVQILQSAGDGHDCADDQHSAGQTCSCLCHAGSLAAVTMDAPGLALVRRAAAMLHPAVDQSMTDAPRAGIEYPPRAV